MSEWNPKQKALESKTFCVLPWMHQYVGPPGDVKPCCAYDHRYDIGSLKEETLSEIWNNDRTKQLRLDMLNGVEREECFRCKDNNTAYKSWFNDEYFKQDEEISEVVASTKIDGTVEDHKLYYMDVRFNNLCNFGCRTCGPRFSTSLIMEHRKIYDKPEDDKTDNEFQFPGKTEEQAFDEIVPHLPYLKELYFAGGEPMMQKEHYMTIEKLVECGNTDVQIKYNTNFSKLSLGRWDVIEYWKKLKNVMVNASLDASHDKAAYWRKGTVWKETVANRRRMIEEVPHVRFNISCTLSWPNAFNFLDLHKEWVEEGLVNVNQVLISELHGPIYFALKNIPNWKKEKITQAFEEHIVWMKSKRATGHTINAFESAIKFMDTGEYEPEFPTKPFHRIVSRLDYLREESFFDVFPEHNDMREWMREQGYEFDNKVYPPYDITGYLG